jgi:hypothetical protein
MSEKQPIVSILGNSVPLLIQPFRQGAHDKTYIEHLRDDNFTILNASKQSVILSDYYYFLEDECIRYFPDYVIIHTGIVECTYRARPRWLQNVFSMNAWNNSVIGKKYNGPVKRGIKYIVKKIYRKSVERPLYMLGIKGRWLGPKDFRFIIKDISKRIFSDTPVKKIILIGMLPISSVIERQAPGTQKSIIEYNQILKSLSEEYPNIIYFDPQSVTSADSQSEVSSDGIHLTSLGHKLLAEKLKELLHGERVEYTEWQRINQYENLYKIYENSNKRKASRQK